MCLFIIFLALEQATWYNMTNFYAVKCNRKSIGTKCFTNRYLYVLSVLSPVRLRGRKQKFSAWEDL